MQYFKRDEKHVFKTENLVKVQQCPDNERYANFSDEIKTEILVLDGKLNLHLVRVEEDEFIPVSVVSLQKC